jgi:hypothetical protein
MNLDEKERQAKTTLKNGVRKRASLASYFFMGFLGVADTLLSTIALILDNKASAKLFWLWFAFAGGVLSLVFFSWLSALYFADNSGEPSERRIGMVGLTKLLIRVSAMVYGSFTLVAISQGSLASETGWKTFLWPYAIVVISLEAILFFYTLWHNAWVKENPDRYVTPTYPVEVRQEEPLKAKENIKEIESTDVKCDKK